MPASRGSAWPLIGLIAAAAFSGCDSGPKTYPVRGRVIVKGSNASLGGGTVVFQSIDNPELQASGYIEDDGAFELFSNQEKSGIPAGEHRVLVQPPSLETGQRKIIDDKYRSFETSGLTQTITPGPNEIQIELDGPKRR